MGKRNIKAMEFYQTYESAEEILCLLKKRHSYFCRNGPETRGEKQGKNTQVRYTVIISRTTHRTCFPPAARSNSSNWNLFIAVDLFTAQRAQPETTAMLTEWGDVSVGPVKGRNPKSLGSGGVGLRRTVKHLCLEVDQL